MLYELLGKDDDFDIWLFHDWKHGKLCPRDCYADYICPKCGKVDECQALDGLGVSNDFIFSTKCDWLITPDSWVIVSMKFITFMEEHGVKGIRYLPIPITDAHFIIRDVMRVKTNMQTAEFLYTKPQCPRCRRYKEVLVGPVGCSMDEPEAPSLFASEQMNDNTKGAFLRYFANDGLIRSIKKVGLKGLHYMEAI